MQRNFQVEKLVKKFEGLNDGRAANAVRNDDCLARRLRQNARSSRADAVRYEKVLGGEKKLFFSGGFRFFIAFIADGKRLNIIENSEEVGRFIDMQSLHILPRQECQQKT